MTDLQLIDAVLNASSVRKVVENGREYFVAPISLIVPGVLAGSKGALYYPESEVKSNPGIWNNVPIVVYHPTDPTTGVPQSAREGGVLERSGIGFLRNDRYENGKRIADGYIDAERVKRIDKRVYDVLSRNGSMETSTGLFTKNLQALQNSYYKGRQYHSIATQYKPDHLAVLPDQIGACSLNDGCGLNVNSRNALLATIDQILNANPHGCNQHTGPGCGGGAERAEVATRTIKTLLSGFKPTTEGFQQLSSDLRKLSVKDKKQLLKDFKVKTKGKTKEDHVRALIQLAGSKPEAEQTKPLKIERTNFNLEAKSSVWGDVKAAWKELFSKKKDPITGNAAIPTLSPEEFIEAYVELQDMDDEEGANRLAELLEDIDMTENQGRHLESGQFLNKTGAGVKQTTTAAGKGFADLDGEQHTDELGEEEDTHMTDEEFIDTIVGNINPDGCNQHTGPGCGSGSNHTEEQSTSIKETVAKLKAPGAHVATRQHAERQAAIAWDNKSSLRKAFPKDKDFIKAVGDAWESSQTTNKTIDSVLNLRGSAMSLTANQKDQVVTYLVTNCDCWKNKEKVLNGMEDDTLIDIVKDVRNRQEDTIIANSVKSGVKIGNEMVKYDPETKTITKNACGMEGNDKTGSHMTAEEVAEEGDRTPAELVDPKTKVAPSRTTKPTVEKVQNEMTDAQFDKLCINHFGHPAATVKAGLGVAMELEQQKRQNLVRRLVANVSDENERKQLAINFLTKPISELETLVKLVPQPQPSRVVNKQPDLSFLGIAGGPVSGGSRVDNASDDTLETPVMNWADMDCVSPAFRKKN